MSKPTCLLVSTSTAFNTLFALVATRLVVLLMIVCTLSVNFCLLLRLISTHSLTLTSPSANNSANSNANNNSSTSEYSSSTGLESMYNCSGSYLTIYTYSLTPKMLFKLSSVLSLITGSDSALICSAHLIASSSSKFHTFISF